MAIAAGLIRKMYGSSSALALREPFAGARKLLYMYFD
jgi:hypothetical protein